MSRAQVAVLQFPGLNCESESLRVLERVGVDSALVRWNEPAGRLAEFAGFFIPGGWSYQDRVRAGAIASKSSLMDALTREVEKGKPALGICNGAQILVESGLVPGRETGRIEMGLAPNSIPGREGYFSRWVYVNAGERAASFFTEGIEEPFALPIAHAEGRFLTRDAELATRYADPADRPLYYCDAEGAPADAWPALPNGSLHGLAGVSGMDGQVLAFMPHPERSAWLWQVPEDLPGPWGERRRAAAGDHRRLEQAGPGMELLRAFAKLNVGGGA
jgi:phosphoribosylformylglycinamidine synthase